MTSQRLTQAVAILLVIGAVIFLWWLFVKPIDYAQPPSGGPVQTQLEH